MLWGPAAGPEVLEAANSDADLPSLIPRQRRRASHLPQHSERAGPCGLPQPTNERLLLFPVYLRANANLAAPHLMEAAADFQEILDHRGIVFNEPIGALAHLGLARAYALQGDSAKAKVAYNNFLTLWKNTDPDIPILKQAKAEYAKLQ